MSFLNSLKKKQSWLSITADENYNDVTYSSLDKSIPLSDTESIRSGLVFDTSQNPFRDPEVSKYWSKVYEEAGYECNHLFDPEFYWTDEEEKQLKSKLDWKVTALACFMFVGLQIDRGNLGQAVSDNLLGDLGLTTADYNIGNLIWSASFLSAELPSGLIAKALGPDVWLPVQMILWSIVAIAQAGLTGRTSFFITRALIAALEGGFIPDIVLWLSYFFTSEELSVRLALFWTSSSLCQVLTALLAFVLLRLRGFLGLAGWRWLFMIEGIFTLAIGIASYFLMVPSAAETKTKWNPQGWFTEREEKIVVNRVLRNDPSKGDMHNRQGLSFSTLSKSILDYDLWPIYALGFIAFIPVSATDKYFTLTLKNLGFSTFTTNLLTIPFNLFHISFLLGITWLSEIVQNRSLVTLINPIWSLPLLAILTWWEGAFINKWGTWLVITLLLSVPYIHAINVSWCSRNSNSIRTRAVSAAIYNMFNQAGGMVASQIYQPDDAPYYHKSNKHLFFISGLTFLLIISIKIYYLSRNSYKEKIWNSMTDDEQIEYIHNTSDEGNKRLDFRFAS
ncbi:putative transporter [Wickerhamomyces ciferrii]|uniref:Transporter n=1 Tax=Wickerhamomyces ciferrii (strain ATCC 14091 / BCRC 22168 / CBS 111 / JCM 3599 / NBRC 0793 / NRRL Y-1031 F-60-10) TaxID=1206466 RepID=K0KEI0_WICCF|nr:putative transporter [Wickerhamomyces ciferrii]CCH41311.1 putative transporter [Wickerhamomyces ciferrii]